MKKGLMTRLMLFGVVTLLSLQGCKYPRGSVVALTIIHSCDLLEPIDLFGKSLLERMRIASQKKGDFSIVPQVFYNETNTFPATATHAVEIRLDTLFLLKIPKADKESEAVRLIHDKYRRAKDRLIPDIYMNGLDRSKFIDYEVLFSQLGLTKKSTPFIGVEVRVIDIKTKDVLLQFKSHEELLSSIIIPAKDQLAEMLTILRDTLQRKVIFIKA